MLFLRCHRSLYVLSRGYVPRILSGCSTQGSIGVRSYIRSCARYRISDICVSERISQMNLHIPSAPYIAAPRAAQVLVFVYISAFSEGVVIRYYEYKVAEIYSSLYILYRGYVPRILSECSSQGSIGVRSLIRTCARYYISVIYVSERISQMNLHIPSAPHIAAQSAAQVLVIEDLLAENRYAVKICLWRLFFIDRIL